MSKQVRNLLMSPFSIIIVFVIFSITGLVLIKLVPIQLLPSEQSSKIIVQFSWANASPLAIEQEVTSILEGAFSSIKGLESIRSATSNGEGSIYLVFNKSLDINIVQQEISSLLRNKYSHLPQGVSYPQIKIGENRSDGDPILVYTLLTNSKFEGFTQPITEKITASLLRNSGIEKVQAYNLDISRVNIRYDFYKMKLLGITVDQLYEIIKFSQIRKPLGSGIYDSVNNKSISIVMQTMWKDHINWEEIPIKKIEDRIITLKDIASISVDLVEPSTFYRINADNTNNIVIYSKEGENQLKLANSIKKQIGILSSDLPTGCTLLLVNDPTSYISESLFNVAWRGALTIIILFFLVFLYSKSWTRLFILFLCLLTNFLISFLFYYAIGIELQIYSLAGITVSLGLIIDSMIVMIDHIWQKNNKYIFLPILASILTTIAALSVVLMLSENLRLVLQDFVLIIIVNLFVSLFVTLFLVPALILKLFYKKKDTLKNNSFKILKRKLAFSKWYELLLQKLLERKIKVVLIFVLAFGMPIFLLPPKVEGESLGAKVYNTTIGTDFYNNVLRGPINMLLGGSLRLFVENVDGKHYFAEKLEPKLSIVGFMPKGTAPAQINSAFVKLEEFLKQFPQIEKFESTISSTRGQINISFKKEYIKSDFPSQLQGMLESNVSALGSAEWQIFGVEEGFSNVMRTQNGSYSIKITGYNYNDILIHATNIKNHLLDNPRIKNVEFQSQQSKFKISDEEYHILPDLEKLSRTERPLTALYKEIRMMSGQDEYGGSLNYKGTYTDIALNSSNQGQWNTWNMSNNLILSDKGFTKLYDVGKIEKASSISSITKVDQNFQLFLNYDFVGPSELGNELLDETVELFKKNLPVGFNIEAMGNRILLKKEKIEQYFSLLIIALIIYFICSILFESFLQPLSIIAIIPFNFIGIFITYYLFDIKFNPGAYAAFVFLTGLTVNSTIYIINEINLMTGKGDNKSGTKIPIKTYVKAFNCKIVPIMISILATIFSLLPFLIGTGLDDFWISLIAGTVGGLLFSILSIYILLPIFLLKKLIRS